MCKNKLCYGTEIRLISMSGRLCGKTIEGFVNLNIRLRELHTRKTHEIIEIFQRSIKVRTVLQNNNTFVFLGLQLYPSPRSAHIGGDQTLAEKQPRKCYSGDFDMGPGKSGVLFFPFPTAHWAFAAGQPSCCQIRRGKFLHLIHR